RYGVLRSESSIRRVTRVVESASVIHGRVDVGENGLDLTSLVGRECARVRGVSDRSQQEAVGHFRRDQRLFVRRGDGVRSGSCCESRTSADRRKGDQRESDYAVPKEVLHLGHLPRLRAGQSAAGMTADAFALGYADFLKIGESVTARRIKFAAVKAVSASDVR